MTKQFNVSNIKSILFYDADYEQCNNTTYAQHEFYYAVAFNNITSLSYDDEKHEFEIKSDDVQHALHANEIYVLKNDMNKRDDFDKYAKTLRAINDFNLIADADEIKSIETKISYNDEFEQYDERVYLISQNDKKYLLCADSDDCSLMNDDEYDENYYNSDEFTHLNDLKHNVHM